MSGPRLAGLALVVAILTLWAVRSFVFDGGAGGESPTGASAAEANTGGTDDSTAEAELRQSPTAVVAAGDLAGVPVGYPQSDSGAATAAVNWVASFPTIVRMGPIRLQDTIATLLSERRSASGTEEVVADYFTLIDELGSDFAGRVWIESPLQVDVVEQADDSAVVAVWALLVTGDPDGGHVDAVWRTHRIELVWERDDWRIDDVTIAEGPTPAPNEVALPSPASDFIEVDGWEPAVFAGTTANGAE